MVLYSPPLLSIPFPTLTEYLVRHFSLGNPPKTVADLCGVLNGLSSITSYGESCAILAGHIYHLYFMVEESPSNFFFKPLAEELVGNYMESVMGVLNSILMEDTDIQLIDTPENIHDVIDDVSYLMLLHRNKTSFSTWKS